MLHPFLSIRPYLAGLRDARNAASHWGLRARVLVLLSGNLLSHSCEGRMSAHCPPCQHPLYHSLWALLAFPPQEVTMLPGFACGDSGTFGMNIMRQSAKLHACILAHLHTLEVAWLSRKSSASGERAPVPRMSQRHGYATTTPHRSPAASTSTWSSNHALAWLVPSEGCSKSYRLGASYSNATSTMPRSGSHTAIRYRGVRRLLFSAN